MKNQLYQVLSKNTMRSYEQAAKSFELATGRKIQEADEESITAFQTWMKERGFKVSTIRTRLSAVSVLAGVMIDLPKRQKSKEPMTLSAEQVRALMSAIKDQSDRTLLMKLLMLGPQARTISEPSAISEPPFIEVKERTLDAQQASRKIKRYARRAGLNEKQISLRVWCRTGKVLRDSMSAAELVSLIGHNPDPPERAGWKPLHGIGRRKRS